VSLVDIRRTPRALGHGLGFGFIWRPYRPYLDVGSVGSPSSRARTLS